MKEISFLGTFLNLHASCYLTGDGGKPINAGLFKKSIVGGSEFGSRPEKKRERREIIESLPAAVTSLSGHLAHTHPPEILSPRFDDVPREGRNDAPSCPRKLRKSTQNTLK